MSNNNGLSSLFKFLANTVRNLEIPYQSPITCSVTDAPSMQSTIMDNYEMDLEKEFSYTLDSVEYICQDCNESFSSAKLHANHAQQYHVDVKPYESTGIKNLTNLFKKISSDSPQNSAESNDSKMQFACKDNEILFNISENIQSKVTGSTKHDNSNTPKTVLSMYASRRGYYECNICEAKFLHRENINKHVRVNHLQNLLGGSKSKSTSVPENQYKCEICDNEFFNWRNLEEHKRDNHPVNQHKKIKLQCITELGRKFKCNMCSSRYTHRRDLSRHKRVKHQLNVSENEELKLINEARIKLKCDMCPREYIRSCDLTRHKHSKHPLKVTEVEKPNFVTKVDRKFECNICQASFDTSRSVLIHKRNKHPLSDNEKPKLIRMIETNFKCDVCRKYYSCFKSLRRHKLNLHPSDGIKNSSNCLNA